MAASRKEKVLRWTARIWSVLISRPICHRTGPGVGLVPSKPMGCGSSGLVDRLEVGICRWNHNDCDNVYPRIGLDYHQRRLVGELSCYLVVRCTAGNYVHCCIKNSTEKDGGQKRLNH